MKKKQNEIKTSQTKFRHELQKLMADKKLQQQLIQYMEALPPKDFCEMYFKLLPYAYSKAPEEKTTQNNQEAKMIERQVILKGIQNLQDNNIDEDEIFDEED